MNQSLKLAHTPEEVAALRARIFVDGADEIGRIDVVCRKELNVGKIGVVLDAIHRALGRSERDFAIADERLRSLLAEAFTEVYSVRLRNDAHLYNEIKRNICSANEICAKKAEERDRIERFIRRVAGKMTNGHAGVWI